MLILGFPIGIRIPLEILISGSVHHVHLVEFVFAALILPLYYATVYYFLSNKFSYSGNFKAIALVVLVSIIIGSRIEYNQWWGPYVKTLDAESRDVVEVKYGFQFLVSLVLSGFAIFAIRVFRKQPEKKGG